MTDTIELSFVTNRYQNIELCAVRYQIGGIGESRLSVRGKTAGAYPRAGTFQWTSAVQGACAVFISTLLHHKQAGSLQSHVQGGKASVVSSLDYAHTKGPIWIADMFGTTGVGALRAKRLFRITNPNRKRPGPVTIALNTHVLPADSLRVTLDAKPVEDPSTLLWMLQVLLGEDGEPAVDRAVAA